MNAKKREIITDMGLTTVYTCVYTTVMVEFISKIIFLLCMMVALIAGSMSLVLLGIAGILKLVI